jgi:hypothetical protein
MRFARGDMRDHVVSHKTAPGFESRFCSPVRRSAISRMPWKRRPWVVYPRADAQVIASLGFRQYRLH